MNSTCTSDPRAGKADDYLRVEGLDITYKIFTYPVHTLRDKFVSVCKDPMAIFRGQSQDFHLIKDLHLTLRKGERLGLLGINGSGKTSLCRYIAGMHGGNERIMVRGKVRAIFDTDSCFLPELTGRENGMIMAKLLFPELSAPRLKEMVEEAIAFSEIGKFAETPFKNYSKGMKARLFLSLVSSLPSDLLILDEVFDGADIFFNEKITARILKMIHESGAVIFVGHSLEHVRTVCNRVVVLSGGRSAFDGSVEEGISFYRESCSKTAIRGA